MSYNCNPALGLNFLNQCDVLPGSSKFEKMKEDDGEEGEEAEGEEEEGEEAAAGMQSCIQKAFSIWCVVLRGCREDQDWLLCHMHKDENVPCLCKLHWLIKAVSATG